MHDVIVVGSGPAGSYAARCLAARGYDVLVLEEHEQVGHPANCSGLIGTEAFERYDLPRRSILRSFQSARFIAPGGEEALVSAGRPVAYVTDRAEFDRSLAEQAQAAGARYRLGTRCMQIVRANGAITASVVGRDGWTELKARAAVVATGVRYDLLRTLGAPVPKRFLSTAQAEVRMAGVNEVEVYLGRRVSPGSFGWAIPMGGERVKLGICNGGRALAYMERLLEEPRIKARLLERTPKIRSKPIPISPAPRTYFDRVLLVGDAAGQVKPTTGGGIYYGIVCAEIAARTLDEGIARGDLSARTLARYETRWRQAIGRELRVGRYFRWLGGRLRDSQINGLIRSYREPDFRDLVHRTAAFEQHSRFILALSRSPFFWSLLAKSLCSGLFGTLPAQEGDQRDGDGSRLEHEKDVLRAEGPVALGNYDAVTRA